MPTPKLNDSTFLQWSFLPEEEISAKIFTSMQKLYLQNERALIAERILGLRYNPEKPMEFLQEDAALRSQLDMFTYLLDASNQAEDTLRIRQLQQR